MKMQLYYYTIFACLMFLCPSVLPASHCNEFVFQCGWFSATQGKGQHVNIDGLIGDDFSVKKSTDNNVLIGLGYYWDCLDIPWANISWGANAFYLAPTTVKGYVTQEGAFTNLSYQYSLTHYPIYFAAKALVHCYAHSDLTLDVGIGPNILRAGDFKERSLDGGITIPDAHIFSGKNSVSFSATAGLGWRVNAILETFSLEVNYRFFYLGEGRLQKNNSQLKNTLRTGHSYANALFLSISI